MNYINKSIFVIYFLKILLFSDLIAQNIDYYRQLNSEGKYQEVLKSIDHEIKKNPNNCDLYLTKIESIILNYQKDTSEKYLHDANSVLESMSNIKECGKYYNSNILNQLYLLIYRKAGIYMNIENYKDALTWFKIAINTMNYLNKKDMLLFLYTGIAAYQAGDFNYMEKCFKNLIDNNTNIKEPYELLILYYLENHLYNKMFEIFDKTLKLNIKINEEIVKMVTSKAMSYNNCNFLINYSNKILRMYSIHGLIAEFYYKCNDTVKSIEIYKEMLKYNPNDTVALTNLGIIYYNTGIMFLNSAKKIINENEKNIDLYRKQKDIYIQNIKLSVSYLENALKNNVNSSLAVKCLYEGYKNLQRKEEMKALKLKFTYLE